MRALLVYPQPKKDQSVECYISGLALENGHPSSEVMMRLVFGLQRYDVNQLTSKKLMYLTGHDAETIQNLGLLPSEIHSQPTHLLDALAIPSYHLRKQQWFCPHCFQERKYMSAKWKIAWLPLCLKHRCALINTDLVNWSKGAMSNFGEAANDAYYDEDLFKIQSLLESKLEKERLGSNLAIDHQSVVEMVNQQLFKSLGDPKIRLLMDRKRKYGRRYFPYDGENVIKFMQCLLTQLDR